MDDRAMAGTITCRAAVAWSAESLSVEEIHVHPPQEGEVRVKLLYSSLCHSDITYWRGKGSTTFPTIFGHEGSGIVESVGGNVEGLRPGDHVISVFQPECTACSYCKRPETNVCILAFAELGDQGVMLKDRKTRFSSLDGKPIYHFLGCSTFTEYTVMHQAHVAKVDPDVPLDKICLLSCGVPTGFGAARNIAKVEAGSTVAIFGLGTVGLAVAEGSKLAGASKIIGIDIQPSKLEIATKFGVTDFVNPGDHEKPIYEVIQAMTSGGVDYCFECVGKPQLMVNALECCHAYGVFIIVGVSPVGEKISFDPNTLLFGREVRSGCLGRFKARTALPELVDKFKAKELNLDQYITHRLPLANIYEGFELLMGASCVKCVFETSTA